jgi:SAM-dependent methyltransferase
MDPLWAIMTEADKRHGGWADDEFFATGEREVRQILDWASVHGLPARHARALDFGCGVGRLTRALAGSFDRCLGVDISPRMVGRARARHAGVAGLSFAVGSGEGIDEEAFDLVLTLIVRTIAALAAAVRPGGVLVLSIPNHIPALHRLQPRPRIYRMLRRLGLGSELLYERLGLNPIRMQALGDARLRRLLGSCGLDVVDAIATTHGSGVRSSLYLAARG